MKSPIPESWFEGKTPAHLGPGARPEAWSSDACREAFDGWLAARGERKAERRTDCLRALLLLWNDHLGEAHALVQDLPGADAAFVHGIMHRREPDAGNARYWFHRVGGHPAFETLAAAALPHVRDRPDLAGRLLPDGVWDPFAFIEAVDSVQEEEEEEEASQHPDLAVLRGLQQLEVLALARHLSIG